MNIYQARLMDYFQHPRNRGLHPHANFSSGQYNPSCGDRVTIAGMVENGIITACLFEGKGCVISQAAASMVAEHAVGKSVQDVLAWHVELVKELVGVPLGPTRLKCAELVLIALHAALRDYSNKVDHA